MLKELSDVPQVPGEPRRRWFTSRGLDLIVWYGPESEPVGFRLCYREGAREHAFTWTEDRGFEHHGVDDGEARVEKHKMSPTLVTDGLFDRENLLFLFQGESQLIDPSVAALVEEKIRAYDPAAVRSR